MSTPVVAGAAALTRQYFREGWYNWPDGDDETSRNVTELAFDPSAALIKAALVNSAVGMEFAAVNPFTGSTNITLGSPPDNHQVRLVECIGVQAVCSLVGLQLRT